MNILVVGGGAIGGLVTAFLSRGTGHSVTVVDQNREHVAAMRKNGLRVSGYATFVTSVNAHTAEELDQTPELVVLAVKDQDTRTALRAVADWIGPDTTVLSLQNGIDFEAILESVPAERFIGALLTFGGHYEGPGRVLYSGPGTLSIGRLDGTRDDILQKTASALREFHPVDITDNITGLRWSKEAIGAYYVATAVAGEDVLSLLQDEANRALFASLIGEVVRTAGALGIRCEAVDGFDVRKCTSPEAASDVLWDGQRRYWGGKEQQRTGVWRDLVVRHRAAEIGAEERVIKLARTHSVGTPGIQRLVDLVHEVEAGERDVCLANLKELASALA